MDEKRVIKIFPNAAMTTQINYSGCFVAAFVHHETNAGHKLRRLGDHLLVPGNDALEYRLAIRTAEDGLAGALRMRHETGHVSAFVADAGDVLNRPIWIGHFICFTLRGHIAP